MTGGFAAYRGAAGDGTASGAAADEAVDPDGRLRPSWAALGTALEELGPDGLAAAGGVLTARAERRGLVAATWRDGRRVLRPVALDPVPRLLPAPEWARLAAGVEQRHRALNAFLADAYRAAGRRRGDADRAPEVVRAGVLPEWAVAHSPGRDPQAVGLAWAGQPRAALAAVDLARTADGRWVVLGDDLGQPAGLGYALAARDLLGETVPALVRGSGAADPWSAVPLVLSALADAAPPHRQGTPACAVLVASEPDGPGFEQRLLAEALGTPVVRPAELWPRVDGGLEAVVDGERFRVDVLHRWLGDGELAAHRCATGQPLAALLAEAVRMGRLGLVNVPGNGLAADESAYAWVPALIRFYLGEEPLLPQVPTWVLADDAQHARVRDRLHELVLTTVGGYGVSDVVAGPALGAAGLAQLRAEVAAAPHRFVAQEPVVPSTAPVLEAGRLVPRPVGLRVFSVAGASVRALPAPLTRVAPAGDPLLAAAALRPGAVGAAVKDTWLVT